MICYAAQPAPADAMGAAMKRQADACFTAASVAPQFPARKMTVDHLAGVPARLQRAKPRIVTRTSSEYSGYDRRQHVFAVYEKHQTWGRVIVENATPTATTGVPIVNLGKIRTSAGIELGNTLSAVRKRLGAPNEITQHCGQTIYGYDNGCESIQFAAAESRVVAIRAAYGGC